MLEMLVCLRRMLKQCMLPFFQLRFAVNGCCGTGRNFIFGGYSTGTSIYAARAAYSQSKLMLSAGAGSGVVFQQNDLTFGARPPAGPPSHAQHALCSAQHPLPSPRGQAWCR